PDRDRRHGTVGGELARDHCGLVDQVVAGGRSAQLRQLALDGGRVRDLGEHADRGLAFAEVGGDASLVVVVELQAFVVESTGGRAADDAHAERGGSEQDQAGADARAGSPATSTDLVNLDVAGGVE